MVVLPSLFALLWASSALACPFQVRSFCTCNDQLDGVELNCTSPAAGPEDRQTQSPAHSAAIQLMQVLKASQAQLGLLKVLSIHDTPIPVLANNFFAGLYIRQLALVNCGIHLVEKKAFGGLEGVLQELVISGNELKEMPHEALGGLHSLVRLDLSSNSLGELKAEHALPRLPKLVDINLSHNLISAVHKTFFDSVKGTLQTINLGHNSVQDVPASALRGFRMLAALHLHNNQLDALPALSFMNLPVLGLLNLAANRIQHIHRQAFLNAPMLRFLYLSENRLAEILPFQFSSFERLEMLDLSNNWLETLQNDSFAGLPALRQLYLGENRIARIEPHTFAANSSVAVLILEKNRMYEVQKDTFQSLRQLQQLSLKGNKLKSVDAAAFQGNPSLVMLDLSQNELIDLAPATFLSQLNLLLVDLSHNRIVRTPFGAFGRRVATVLLQENPLVCTEQIHMLQQGNGVFIPNNEDAVCGKSTATAAPTVSVGRVGKKIDGGEQLGSEGQQGGSIIRSFSNGAESAGEEMATESAAEEETEAPEEEEEQEPPAFVQQESTQVPTEEPPRRTHIRPIRIGQDRKKGTGTTAAVSRPSNGGLHHSASMEVEFTQNTSQERAEMGSEPLPIREGGTEWDGRETEESGAAEESTVPPTTEVTTVDPRNNPAVIYPHPVPFLAPGPKIHTAHSVGSDENGNPVMETLPPSIVVLSRPSADEEGNEAVDGQNGNEKTTERMTGNEVEVAKNESSPAVDQREKKYEQVELNLNSNHNGIVDLGGNSAMLGEVEMEPAKQRGKPLPTAVIVICMSTVGVVMCAVFVGMCVARKRQLRQQSHSPFVDLHSLQHSPNSNSYMCGAVAARAAQLNNGLIYAPQQGAENETMRRGMRQSLNNNSDAMSLHRLPPVQDDIYGWLYTPNGYNAYAKH